MSNLPLNTEDDVNDQIISFEDFKNENGITYWWASDLALMLGYKDLKTFTKSIDRATKALMALNIPHYENIIPFKRSKDDGEYQDFKLSRFACYLCVMNSNAKLPQVAQAQVYFAVQTRKFELHQQDQDQLGRIVIREDLASGNKQLAEIAKNANVENYANFQNAGYRGMYNTDAWQLAKKRNIEKGKLIESMGATELAANLFRVTLTGERINNQGITGQANLERTHKEVGADVRNMVIKNTGKAPEQLPVQKQLNTVIKELKDDHKAMIKEDKPKKKK